MAKDIRQEIKELTEDIDIKIETREAQVNIFHNNGMLSYPEDREEYQQITAELCILQDVNRRLCKILEDCE